MRSGLKIVMTLSMMIRNFGPSLDNPTLTRDFVVGRIANGQGAMPAFKGQLADEDIALLADYIVEVSHDAAP